MQRRRRFQQTQSLEARRSEEAKRLREEAKLLPPSAQREELIRKARRAETALHAVLRHHLLLAGMARVHLPVHTRVVRHLRRRIGSRRNNRYAGKAGLP